jgi:polyisoprenoid-binding protein YceI
MMSRLVSRSGLLPAFFLMIVLACLGFGASLAPASAQEWKVNKAKSRVSLQLSMDGQPVEGQFGNFKIEMRFDPEEPGDGEITAILDAASLRTGDTARDAALASADWLNAASHPAIRFTSLTIKETDAGRYRMDANLTIKGVSKRVTIPLAIDEEADGGNVQAQLQVSRGAFGIGPAGGGRDENVSIVLDLAATHLTN